jgi:hypothetical protein
MNKQELKSNPAHEGKLLSVEIEYLPNPGTDDISTTAPGGNEALITVVNDGTPNNTGTIKEIRLLTLTNEEGRMHDLLNIKIDGNVNKNCGLHVHVDARHLGKDGRRTAEEVYDILASAPVARQFKKLVSKSRLKNYYCKWKNNRRDFGPRARYAAFNYKSMSEHGTLEFRMHQGSTNKIRIESWALLCQWTLNYVADPANPPITSFATFVKNMPSFLRTFATMRRDQLAGDLELSPRIMQSLVDSDEA